MASAAEAGVKPAIALAAILVSVIVATIIFSNAQSLAPSEPVALGAFIPGVSKDPAKIEEFTNTVGVPPAIVMWYQDWAQSDTKEFNPAAMEAVVRRGAMPMVTWEPWDKTKDKDQPEQPRYAPRTIVTGDHDRYS